MKFLLFFLLIPAVSWSKSFETKGALTFINLTGKISTYSSLTFYHYDVYNFQSAHFEGKKYRPGLIQSYFQGAYNYQYLPRVIFTLGYIFQRNEPLRDSFQNESRIFQQVVLGVQHRSFTSSHRFRLEERFTDNRKEDAWEFRTRLRYQIGVKVPLRGITLDAGEYFLNVYNEFYFSTTGQRNALWSDNWTYFGVGFQTKTMGSFEAGPLLQASVVDRQKDLRYHETIQAGWTYNF
jgi:Protein of unknown function (DUF2490)